MKKIIIPTLLAISLLMLHSCSKIVSENTSIVQTTTQNIRLDSNTITLSDATKLAQLFLQSKNKNLTITIKDAQTIVKNGIPYFHVINANKGFVIVSPDSLYSPLLAYDSINNFSFANKNLNPGLVNWFNKHAHEMDFVRNTKTTYTDSIGKTNKILWRIFGGAVKQVYSMPIHNNPIVVHTGQVNTLVLPPTLISTLPAYNYVNTTVGPLCATQWGQWSPYNQFCPVVNGTQAPTGCVPTAMAQIMYYWGKPSSYLPSFGIAPHVYNWNTMALKVDDSNSNTDPTQHPEYYTGIATLMSDIGSSFIFYPYLQFASYGTLETSADDGNCPGIFNLFGYSGVERTTSIVGQVLSGNDMNGICYNDFLINEIQNNNRPCMIGSYPSRDETVIFWIDIFNPSGDAHEWVCDGSNVSTYYSGYINTYKDFWGNITTQTIYTSSATISLLHMNWGWDGKDYYLNILPNNGWYDCSVNYTQASSVSPNFQYFQTIVYNIHL